MAQEEQKPENSNNLPDGFNTDWLWTDEIEIYSTLVYHLTDITHSVPGVASLRCLVYNFAENICLNIWEATFIFLPNSAVSLKLQGPGWQTYIFKWNREW